MLKYCINLTVTPGVIQTLLVAILGRYTRRSSTQHESYDNKSYDIRINISSAPHMLSKIFSFLTFLTQRQLSSIIKN